MESLSEALQMNRVNAAWQKLAYASLKPLAAWFADLTLRVDQLVSWTSVRGLLKSIWISGLFNSMAFFDGGNAGDSTSERLAIRLHDEPNDLPEHQGS